MQHLQENSTNVLRHDRKPFLKQYRLFLAVFGQFMYVGSEGTPPVWHNIMEVAIATFFINYADEVAGFSDEKSAKLLSAAQGIFTLGRFLGTGCMKWIHARYILAAFTTILVLLTALTSFLDGTAGIALYMVLFFFERCGVV